MFTGYSAVFVDASTIAASSNAQLQADLQSYVLGGGSVFVNLGTGVMSSANEAAAFNTFLGHFGIQAAASYNGIGGVHNTSTWSSAAPYGAGLFGGSRSSIPTTATACRWVDRMEPDIPRRSSATVCMQHPRARVWCRSRRP